MRELTVIEKNNIIDKVMDFLEYAGHNPERKAIEFIIDRWWENKKWIIEEMEKHPQYNGNYGLTLELEVKREFDTKTISEKYDEMLKYYADENGIFKQLMANEGNFKPHETISKSCIDKIMTIIKDNGIKELENVRINENTETQRVIGDLCMKLDMLTKMGKYDKIVSGETVKKDLYNKWYAEVCDAFKTKAQKTKLYLSVDPIEYVTMSWGNSWNSCYDPRDNGCYQAGLIAYMIDDCTMIAYTNSTNTDNGHPKKINRQCWYVNKNVAVQSRLYPQCESNKTQAEKVGKMWADVILPALTKMCGIEYNYHTNTSENLDFIQRIVGGGSEFGRPVCGYNDIGTGSYYARMHAKDKDSITLLNPSPKAYCIDDAGVEIEDHNYLNNDNGYVTCADCGERIREDEAHYINGDYYCDDCVCYCVDCEEYHRRSDGIYMENLNKWVCNDCVDKYYECEECGDWVREDDAVYAGENVYCCRRCAENAGYVWIDRINEYYHEYQCIICDECGETYPKSQAIEIDGMYYCSEECAEDAGYVKVNEEWEEKDNCIKCSQCGKWELKDENTDDDAEYICKECKKFNNYVNREKGIKYLKNSYNLGECIETTLKSSIMSESETNDIKKMAKNEGIKIKIFKCGENHYKVTTKDKPRYFNNSYTKNVNGYTFEKAKEIANENKGSVIIKNDNGGCTVCLNPTDWHRKQEVLGEEKKFSRVEKYKLKHFKNRREQYIFVHEENGSQFVSYNSRIGEIRKFSNVLIIGKDFDYSKTTTRNLCEYLRDNGFNIHTRDEIRNAIKNGELNGYKVFVGTNDRV